MKVHEELYSQRLNVGGLTEERIKRCIKIFRRLRGQRLLDIGCGDGAITVALQVAMRAEEAYGVDIAPEAVAAATKKGIRAYELDIDGGDLPFSEGNFDVVYCGEIIEHLFDPERLLEEVKRVLKPGGTCVLTTPNLAGWPNRIALLLGYQPFPTAVSPRHEGLGKLLLGEGEGQWGHIRVFTLRALRELVQLHEFRIVGMEGCPVTINDTQHRGSSLIGVFDRMLAAFPTLATRAILVLEKDALSR